MRFSTLSFLALPLAIAHPTHHHHHGHESLEPALTTTNLGLLASLFSSPFSAAESLVHTFTSSISDKVNDELEVADPAEKTIWQLLNESPEKYSKIVKLIELDGKSKEVLDDREGAITFFAPDNEGIPDPHHHDDDDDEDNDLQTLLSSPSLSNIHSFYDRHASSLKDDGGDDNDDEDRKERRKKIFKFILRAVLKYHGLPAPVSATELASNNTWATALVGEFGASDGEALRIRVEKSLLPPSLKLNFYAKVVITDSDVKAKNGYLHTIDHPLIPPPSILTAAYLFPKEFSTLTSAVQKVHGQKYLEWEVDVKKSKEEKKPVFYGSPAVTLFAPTNEAFNKLPEKLSLFLFSPFGEKVLTKILAYHALPKQILFSEHYHVAHHDKKEAEFIITGDASFHKEFTAVTGLTDATGKKEGTEVKIVIDKSRVLPVPGAYKTTIKVNDVDVEVLDVPASNGVAHSIGSVLIPPHKHHKDEFGNTAAVSGWEHWESWLMDWAESV